MDYAQSGSVSFAYNSEFLAQIAMNNTNKTVIWSLELETIADQNFIYDGSFTRTPTTSTVLYLIDDGDESEIKNYDIKGQNNIVLY